MEKTIFNRQIKASIAWVPGLLFGFGVDKYTSFKSIVFAFGFFSINFKIY